MHVFSLCLFIALLSSAAFAQAPEPLSLATPTGHDVSVSVGGYNYEEPGDLAVSIHGPRFGGGYTGTFALDRKRHWFVQADARGSGGRVTYDGWCAPFLITPFTPSPNGYALDIGDYSPCAESGDKDWYVEARGLIGKDFIGRRWAFAPETGLGVRHLSDGVTGIDGYRTDDYLYVPLSLTARTMMRSTRAVSVTVEYDYLLRGWQTTRDSRFGSGDIPATATAPAFRIESFTDMSFEQHQGWAVRLSVKYQVTPRWSVEPGYIYWSVAESTVSPETIAFTVGGVTARQPFLAYEPVNTTREFLVKLGFRAR